MEEPKLNVVSKVCICDACLDGAGGYCNTPGCLFIRNVAPDLSLRQRVKDCGGTITPEDEIEQPLGDIQTCEYCGRQFDSGREGHLHDGDHCAESGCQFCPTNDALRRFLAGKAFCSQTCEAAYIDETPYCRVCGCSDDDACEGGCLWVADPEGLGDLCSACLPKMSGSAGERGGDEAYGR